VNTHQRRKSLILSQKMAARQLRPENGDERRHVALLVPEETNMLPKHTKTAARTTPTVEDHFSLMEDALFRELAEDAALDTLLDQLFPDDDTRA
jgi:hypothetical protein